MVTFPVPSLGGRVRCGCGLEGDAGLLTLQKARPPSFAAAPSSLPMPSHLFQTTRHTEPGGRAEGMVVGRAGGSSPEGISVGSSWVLPGVATLKARALEGRVVEQHVMACRPCWPECGQAA